MRGLSTSRVAPPLVVVVALAAAYSLAAFTHPFSLAVSARSMPPRGAPVTTALRACPAPGQPGSSAVAMIAAPGGEGAGQAAIRWLSQPTGAALFTAAQAGQLAVMPVHPVARDASRQPSPSPSSTASNQPAPAATSRAGVTVQASGAMARGLEVEQVAGSIATAECGSPGTDFWFVGPGQHIAGRIELYLMNPGSQAADVNVAIATDAGPLQGAPDAGLSVAPHSMLVQSLGSRLRGSRVIALHVRTSVGQVVASVQEITGTARSGAWLPAAQAPATRVVIPGLPAVAGTRDLYVTVPGTRDAHLRLTAITTRGTYEPTGAGGLDLPGGSAADIALPSLAGIPAALKVSATVPVTASLMISGGTSGAPGVISAAAPPLTQQGVVADSRVGSGWFSELVLSAPGREVRARIWRGVSGSAGATDTVTVNAGRSLVVQLGKVRGLKSSQPLAVVITPLAGSGPLYAGRIEQSSGSAGALESILPVSSALVTVPLPPVRQTFVNTRR